MRLRFALGSVSSDGMGTFVQELDGEEKTPRTKSTNWLELTQYCRQEIGGVIKKKKIDDCLLMNSCAREIPSATGSTWWSSEWVRALISITRVVGQTCNGVSEVARCLSARGK